MGSWPVIKDLIGFCFFTIFLSRNGPSRRLNNNRNTSALMPERGKTPPSNVNPQPSLFELKETTFSSLRATRPSFSSLLYLTFPLFPVSFLVWKLPKIRALVLVTITLVAWLCFYFFSFRLQKCQSFFFNFEVQWALAELMSWTRWKGLRLAFI